MLYFHSLPSFSFTSNADKQRKKLEKRQGRNDLTKQHKRKKNNTRLNAGKNPSVSRALSVVGVGFTRLAYGRTRLARGRTRLARGRTRRAHGRARHARQSAPGERWSERKKTVQGDINT